jgi:hypothetical protein
MSSALLLSLVSPIFFNSQKADAAFLGGTVAFEYLGGPVRGNAPAIKLTPKHPLYQYYRNLTGNDTVIMFKTMYKDSYVYFSPIPQQTKYYSLSNIRSDENVYGNAKQLASIQYAGDLVSAANVNLKRFETPAQKVYNRDALVDSTHNIKTGTYAGRYGEWRELGYSESGTAIQNPHFPADVYAGYTLSTYPFDYKPWMLGNAFIGSGSTYDTEASDEKNSISYNIKRAAVMRLLEVYPDLQQNAIYHAGGSYRGSLTSERLLSYWIDRLSLADDTSGGSSGVFTGTRGGGGFYTTLAIPADGGITRNLAIIREDVYDSENQLVAVYTYDKATQQSATWQARELKAGEVMTVKSTVQNDSDNPTTTDGISVDFGTQSGWNATQATNSLSGANTDYIGTTKNDGKLSAGQTTLVSHTMTIPSNTRIVSLASVINSIHDVNGENLYHYDDYAETLLDVNPEKGNFSANDIVLVDKDGNEVENAIPGEEYKVRFKYLYTGDNATDSMSLTLSYKLHRYLPNDSYDEKWYAANLNNFKPQNGQTYSITSADYVIYETGSLDAYGTIENGISAGDGNYNTSTTDDDRSESFKGTYDYTISDFELVPDTTYDTEKGANTITYLASMTVNSEVPAHVTDYENDVDFIISINGQQSTVMKDVHIAQGENKNVTFKVAYQAMDSNKAETIQAKAFVNSNQEVYETNYTNNTATTDAIINPAAKVTVPSTKKNANTWTQSYQTHTWDGAKVTYAGLNNSFTRTFTNYTATSGKDWESVELNENYKITHVWFRSKVTTDKKEGVNKDGWVDLMDGKVGKIKAGYGYELKIEVEYDTDAFTKYPKETTNRWIRPSLIRTEIPNNIYVKTPDSAIHSAFGDGGTTASLVLNNNGQRLVDTESKLRMQFIVEPTTTLGVSTVGRFYIGSDVANGIYELDVFTPKVHGLAGKLTKTATGYEYDTTTLLSDIAEDLKIQVIGSAVDDVSDHISD